jgi:hypothetical protein
MQQYELPDWITKVANTTRGELLNAVPHRFNSSAWLLIFEQDQRRRYILTQSEFGEPRSVSEADAKVWIEKQAPKASEAFFPPQESTLHVDARERTAAREATAEPKSDPVSADSSSPRYEMHPLCKKVPCLAPSDYAAYRPEISWKEN